MTAGPETEACRQYLISQIEAHTRTSAEHVRIEATPPRVDGAIVPERICAWARGVGVAPPSAEQWAKLSPLQRFALYKLTRPGHSNESFLHAMREFSLLTLDVECECGRLATRGLCIWGRYIR